MNDDVVKSDLFKSAFETFWNKWKEEIEKWESPSSWWEETKTKIKEIAI